MKSKKMSFEKRAAMAIIWHYYNSLIDIKMTSGYRYKLAKQLATESVINEVIQYNLYSHTVYGDLVKEINLL